MGWRMVFTESLASLRFHRRRTAITIISLAWGVACFVILMSYGKGFGVALERAFRAVGQDLIIMASGQTSEQAGGLRAGRRVRLEYADAATLKETVPQIGALSPEAYRSYNVRMVRGSREQEPAIRAVWPEYGIVRNMSLTDGRWINEDDHLHERRVAVLGADLAKELFSGIPPVGEEVRLNGLTFSVIGVLERKIQISNYSRPDNRCVFIPYNTMRLFGDIKYPTYIVWMPVSPDVRDKGMQAVRAKLAEIHRFSPTDEKAVFMLAFSQFMSIITGMSLALQVLLGLVGALTLGIGGVGLANIMLASVIDRIREIGMMKALGAFRRLILRQFLIEASLIVVAGGLLGIALGLCAAWIIGSMPFLGPLFEDTTTRGDIHLKVSAASLAVSTGVLLFVGLVAGMVPAIKASRLDPIEALRYE